MFELAGLAKGAFFAMGKITLRQGANAARLSTNSVRLAQQLASEAQLAERGIVIISNLRSGGRLAKTYGGTATDWVKRSSSSFSINGRTFETHWYENLINGLRVEQKTILVKGW
jgi:hypothetical protein